MNTIDYQIALFLYYVHTFEFPTNTFLINNHYWSEFTFLEYHEQSGKCKSFEISFSIIEKYIITHVDGTLKRDEDTETCKKDVLRLLKLDLEELSSKSEGSKRNGDLFVSHENNPASSPR